MTTTTSRKTELLLVIALLLFSLLGAKPALAQTPESCITFGFTGFSVNTNFDPVGNTTTYDFTFFNLTPILGTFVNVGEIFIFGLPVPTSTSAPPGWEFKNVGPKTFFETTDNPWWKTPPAIPPMGTQGGFQYVISGAPVPITAIVNHVQQVTDATGQVPIASTWFDCATMSGTACIDVTKSANPTQGIAGTIITYTFTVENCGQVPLTSVTVNDSLVGDITADFIAANGGSDTLAVSSTVMFTVDRAIQASDPITLINVVTACGLDPTMSQTCDSDSATVDVIKPCISVVKTATPTSALVGQNITYNFTVTNCGTVVLNNVTVTDTVLGNLTALFIAANGGSSSLNPSASVQFSTNRAIAGGDPDPLINVVTACGTSPQIVMVCDQDQAEVDIIPTPPPAQVSISGGSFNNIGCTGVLAPTDPPLGGATFTLTTTTGGPVFDVFGFLVTPQMGSTYNFVHISPGTYRVVETNPAGFMSTNAIPGSCGGSTKINNDVVQVAATVAGVACINNDFLDCQSNPCIDIIKVVDPVEAPIGTDVDYEFTVNNCGDVALTNVTVVDTLLGDITADFIAANSGSDTLAISATVMFTVVRKVTSETPNPILNTVTVTGDDPFGNPVTDSDDGKTTIPITISGGAFNDLACDGVLDPTDPPLSGATFTLTDALGNTVRDIGGNIVVPQTGSTYSFTSLPPGFYVVTETNPAGFISTNALPGPSAVKLTDDKIKVDAVSHTNFPNNDFLDCRPESCISVVCSIEPETASPGDTLTISIEVCNCGDAELTDVTVVSNQVGDITDLFIAANGGSDALPVGKCVLFQIQLTVNGGEEFVFIVDAAGRDPSGAQRTDSSQCTALIIQPSVDNKRRCFLPVTFTQQGWTDNCEEMVYNKFRLAFANFTFFGTTYPNRMIVGGRYTITYEGTTGGLLRLCLFLPQTGPCGKLRWNHLNPWDSTQAGVLAGEVVALMMNLAYNDERLMPRSRGYDLENFVINEGLLRGHTVGQTLNIANQVLAGAPVCMFGLPDCDSLVDILQAINANYEWVDYDTFNDRRYLTPNRPFGQPDPPHPPVVPY